MSVRKINGRRAVWGKELSRRGGEKGEKGREVWVVDG